MFDRSTAGWPLTYGDTRQAQPPHGGVAPLRYDLALSRYLEKQAAYRASTARQFDIWSAPLRLCLRIAHGALAVIRVLRTLPPERQRDCAS